jgi:heme/copper-type cytochrome/quinol oxidase subunit 3
MTEVPRSMQATTAPAVVRVTRSRRAQSNGWWGVALLIATEAALFGTLIASYFYLRVENRTWPPPGVRVPDPLEPIILTAVVVVTSVPMLLAARAVRTGGLARIRVALAVALAVDAGYLVAQLHAYAGELAKHEPHDSAYSSIYYTLLGVHHVHVVVGMLLIAGLLVKLRKGLTNYRANGVRAIALYWHFTNAVGIAVLLTQMSPRL